MRMILLLLVVCLLGACAAPADKHHLSPIPSTTQTPTVEALAATSPPETTIAETTQPPTVTVTPPPASKTLVGRWDRRHYSNSYFGLSFTLPGGWNKRSSASIWNVGDSSHFLWYQANWPLWESWSTDGRRSVTFDVIYLDEQELHDSTVPAMLEQAAQTYQSEWNDPESNVHGTGELEVSDAYEVTLGGRTFYQVDYRWIRKGITDTERHLASDPVDGCVVYIRTHANVKDESKTDTLLANFSFS